MFTCKNKVALVTGGNSGLGLALVEAMMMSGANVAVVARSNYEEVERLAEKYPVKCSFYKYDLLESTKANAKELVDKIVEDFGSIDILFNNAGMNIRQESQFFMEEYWTSILQVNTSAAFYLSQAVASYFIPQRSGKIINTASVLSFQGGILVPAYTASKSAIAGLTRALANEWAQYNIQVNAIAPGYMDTKMTSGIQEDAVRNKDILARIPAKRWGKPEDLQGVAIFLASKASDYCNGTIINVDGGWLSR